jgi:hypothetical protein
MWVESSARMLRVNATSPAPDQTAWRSFDALPRSSVSLTAFTGGAALLTIRS